MAGGKVRNSATERQRLHDGAGRQCDHARHKNENRIKTMIDNRPSARSLRDALWFHLAFFAVAVPVAIGVPDKSLGRAILILAALYNILLPAIANWRGHRQWYLLWVFLLPLSFTLPMADWMLVKRMGTLVFPDHGVPKFANVVPVYFAGLWIMLLWPVCLFASAVARQWSYLAAGSLGLLLFVIWEWAARPLELWHAQNVTTFKGFALYPLIPEALLCVAALWMWRATTMSPRWQKFLGALGVTFFYAGALSLFLLWVEY